MGTRNSFRFLRSIAPLIGIMGFLIAAPGCMYYGPVPAYYQGTTYDHVWDSALRAAEDSGIRLTFTDRNAGIIRGGKENTNVEISVMRQADGRMRVEFNRRGPKDQDPNLQDRFYQAYEGYMGRR
ncbi:MAG: hypothetical protein NTV04_22165 [Deltaproteobacteria bacterium]|nr:hypothetical protein [Deltaproteobacteria bacterium]